MTAFPPALCLALAVVASAAAGAASAAGLRVADLSVEYARNPLGLDTRVPRLGWRLLSARRGQRQTAYRIFVASTAERLAVGQADVWDSGRVASDQSTLVPYGGPPLRSRQRCHWKVRVWDADGSLAPDGETGWWEMGLLEPQDWQARWIGYPPGWTGRALHFRREIEVRKPVRGARLYAAGLGYHELRLNGAKIGDHVLDPAWTEYGRRVLYVSHDVTALVRPGENVLAAIVGHGWHGTPKLLAQLEIIHQDGSVVRVATEGGHPPGQPSWRVTSGALLSDSVYDGEVYDARLEKPGWDAPGKRPGGAERAEGWATAMPVDPPAGRLAAQALEPIRVVETRRPAGVTEPRPGVYLLDTGQNLAGWVRLRVRGERGTRVTLRFAENL